MSREHDDDGPPPVAFALPVARPLTTPWLLVVGSLGSQGPPMPPVRAYLRLVAVVLTIRRLASVVAVLQGLESRLGRLGDPVALSIGLPRHFLWLVLEGSFGSRDLHVVPHLAHLAQQVHLLAPLLWVVLVARPPHVRP